MFLSRYSIFLRISSLPDGYGDILNVAVRERSTILPEEMPCCHVLILFLPEPQLDGLI